MFHTILVEVLAYYDKSIRIHFLKTTKKGFLRMSKKLDIGCKIKKLSYQKLPSGMQFVHTKFCSQRLSMKKDIEKISCASYVRNHCHLGLKLIWYLF